ncbi:MAG: FKBP-type peptidyl-prolyl cis-trans isomerase [Balneolaceae bacterium]
MRLLNSLFSALLVTLVVFTAACETTDPYQVDYSLAPEPFSIDSAEKVETESGLVYYVIEEGSGEEVSRRSSISVFYTGRKMSGEIFDSSYRNGNPNPATFNELGTLVKGFREGLIGMKEGGEKVLIIPPNLGYGGTSHQLSNDTLRFDVELDEIAY